MEVMVVVIIQHPAVEFNEQMLNLYHLYLKNMLGMSI